MSSPDAPHDLLRRAAALAATEAKYRWKPFAWKQGMTCIHMARFHLRKMGHNVEPVPRIRGPIAARRVLDERGHADCSGIFDAMGLQRIAPAAMLPGDIGFRSTPCTLGGLMICATAHKMMGWFDHPGAQMQNVVMDMSFDQLELCWRV